MALRAMWISITVYLHSGYIVSSLLDYILSPLYLYQLLLHCAVNSQFYYKKSWLLYLFYLQGGTHLEAPYASCGCHQVPKFPEFRNSHILITNCHGASSIEPNKHIMVLNKFILNILNKLLSIPTSPLLLLLLCPLLQFHIGWLQCSLVTTVREPYNTTITYCQDMLSLIVASWLCNRCQT